MFNVSLTEDYVETINYLFKGLICYKDNLEIYLLH